jgi:uncharacterized OB-fold protein
MTDIALCPRCGDASVTGHGPVCGTCGGPSRALEAGAVGRIYSWTTVVRGLPGTPVPYTLAYADFEPDLRLLARVVGDLPAEVGAPVLLEADEDAGYRFAPVNGGSA